jgi:polyphosphate kinase
MDRNFFRRIELCFPVLDKKLKARAIREGLQSYLADNAQAWEMDAEGTYLRKASAKSRHSAQDELLELLAREDGG